MDGGSPWVVGLGLARPPPAAHPVAGQVPCFVPGEHEFTSS